MRLFLFTNVNRHAAGSPLSGKITRGRDRTDTGRLEDVTPDRHFGRLAWS